LNQGMPSSIGGWDILKGTSSEFMTRDKNSPWEPGRAWSWGDGKHACTV